MSTCKAGEKKYILYDRKLRTKHKRKNNDFSMHHYVQSKSLSTVTVNKKYRVKVSLLLTASPIPCHLSGHGNTIESAIRIPCTD